MYSRRTKGVRANNMPEPPPNYRGMIYEFPESEVFAEGIARLVSNDGVYMNKAHERSEKAGVNAVKKEPCNSCSNGIQRLIGGLSSKEYLPDDVLICAMILLMLSNSSEDDMLLVLVLLMLL